MPAPSRTSLLDPDAVSRGEALGLLARTVVEGYRVGEHRSPFKGFAIEFAQHREYTTGDDLRHLDWKILGRTDRYYIKQYEQDTNFVAHLLLDGSESMNYGSGPVSKLHYAKALAACLAHLVLVQRDAVALNLFDTDVRERLSRTDNPGRIHHIMDRLAAFQATQRTGLGVALADLARQLKARGIVILISDLLAENDDALATGLRQLRFGGSEVIVFHVLDPHEIDFPFTGTVEFEGLEGAPLIKTQPAAIRKSYLDAFNAWQKSVRTACDRNGCHYVLANTGHSLAETLSGYLAFRQKNSA
ncbi:MAG: hypothetical protein K0R17_740 [Rariglobus sp.]|jgi:uncharacterized protein (DUF58 family)|nr:hypothetical protein [Rariglobus sp.]